MIELFYICREMHALPQAGGVLDQDPELMEAFAAISAELARQAAEESKRRNQ